MPWRMNLGICCSEPIRIRRTGLCAPIGRGRISKTLHGEIFASPRNKPSELGAASLCSSPERMQKRPPRQQLRSGPHRCGRRAWRRRSFTSHGNLRDSSRVGCPSSDICRKRVVVHKAHTENNALASCKRSNHYYVSASYRVFAPILAADNADSSLRIERLYDSQHMHPALR